MNQRDGKFKARLRNSVRPYLKTKNKTKNQKELETPNSSVMQLPSKYEAQGTLVKKNQLAHTCTGTFDHVPKITKHRMEQQGLE